MKDDCHATQINYNVLDLGYGAAATGAGHHVYRAWNAESFRYLERTRSGALYVFSGAVSIHASTWLWMGVAAFSELVGGILVLFGLFTRLGALLIACVMLTAVVGVHWRYGFFINPPAMGFEFALSLLAIALALLIAGGGQASIDKLINRRR